MWNWLKEELTIKNFSLYLADARVFTTSSLLPSYVLLLIRLAITIFCIVCLICTGFQDSSGDTKWFIYLTNWSFTILTISLMLVSGLTAYEVYRSWCNRSQTTVTKGDYGSFESSLEAARVQDAGEAEEPVSARKSSVLKPMPSRWFHCLTWLLYNVSICAGILVTIAYWAAVQEGTPDFLDVTVHALNSVIILTEFFFLGRVPVRLFHCVYLMTYTAIYIIFTVIYWQAGGQNADNEPYIYEIIDYEKKSAGSIVATVLSGFFIAGPLCQLFFFGLYRLRCYWFDPFGAV